MLPMPFLAITGGGGPSFNPASLFASGEKGFFYDPSDFSTMWQDTAGTVPVTAVGQTVARINDKSGNGLHATQATAASRPTLQQDGSGYYHLSYDGIDDGFSTAALDLSATDKLLIVMGLRKGNGSQGILVESTASAGGTPGAFFLGSGIYVADDYAALTSGSSLSVKNFTGFTAPVTSVLSLNLNNAGAALSDKIDLRANGVAASAGAVAVTGGTGNFGNFVIYIGRRGGSSLPFSGLMYPIIVRGASTTQPTIAATETWVNYKTGAY